jgi:hypothetical protein
MFFVLWPFVTVSDELQLTAFITVFLFLLDSSLVCGFFSGL